MKKLIPLLLLTALLMPLATLAQSSPYAHTLPFSTDFEDVDGDTAWGFNNTGNSWYIGSAVNCTPDGSRALYISSTNGTTHSFNPYLESMSYAYQAFNFEEAGQYIVEFDWKNNGLGSFYGMTMQMCWLYAFLVPPQYNITTPAIVFEDDWIVCGDGILSGATSWQHIIANVNITTPGVYSLAFMYYCYGSGGENPPAAIDNVSLRPLGCMQPTALIVDNTSDTSVGIHWVPGGNENAWIVRADGGEWLEIYDTTYLFTHLAPSMLHTLEVAAVCDNGDTSLATSITQRTPCGTVSFYPWRENFTGFSNMATIPCWTHLGDGAYRFYSGEMELRPMGSIGANIVTTPTLVNLSQLELTFTNHPEGASSGSLSVGYVTGPDNSYVFTPVETYDVNEWVNTSTPVEKTVTFPNAPDTARIAFRHNPNSSNFYWYIDDIDVHMLPVCSRPNNLTLINSDENSIELAWSDVNSGSTTYILYYRPSDSSVWDMLTVYDTTVVLTGLTQSTPYDVRVAASCNDGSVSAELTGTFMTTCGDISVFPYEEGFDNGSAFCWQVFSMNSSSTDNWLYTTSASDTRNYSTGAYASSYNDMESCNEWLVSPAIELSDDASNVTLSWYSYARAWSTNQPRVEIKVTTSQEITQSNTTLDTTLFSTTIYAENLDENGFVKHSVSLNQFAGQTIRLAFVRRGYDDYYVILEDINIYPSLEPIVTIAGPASPVVGLTATYRAVLDEGSHDGLTYSWHSAAATAGSATITSVDSATVTLLYTTTAADILTVVATNSHGNDTATLTVNPLVASYTDMPYSTGFETTDDVSWNFANDVANAWYIDTAVHCTGNRALYISNDNGLHNNYNGDITSYSYAYKTFNLANDGQYSLDFDWRCYGEGSYDNLNVYLLPLGTPITAGTDATSNWLSLTGQLITVNSWQHFSSIFNLTVPGVYHLVFAWKNDDIISNNPAAAIDNLMMTAISCMAPSSVTVDTIGTDMARFRWSGTAPAWEVTVGDMVPVVVTDTFYTTPHYLLPATNYTVSVRAICGTNDTSLYTNLLFTTECTPYNIPFSYDFPGSSLSVCWANTFFTPYPATSWSDGASTNHRIYSAAAYNTTPADDWLISPLFNIPSSDTVSLELVYFVNGYPNNNYTASSANYEVLVSPMGDVACSSFTDTLVHESNLNSTAYTRRNISVSQYAGQSIRVAFRNISTFNGRIGLSEVNIRRTREPLFSVQGSTNVWVYDVNLYAALYQEGDLSGMTYTWTSTMAAAGHAVMNGANNDTLSIIYNTMGIDTLTLVTHNSYGNDTIVTYVTVHNLNPVTTLPYSTSFEPIDNDNLSWIALNGTNAWSLGTATSNNGTQAYYISNDHGTTNAYTINATSRSYLYRAFDIYDSASYAVRFDWNAKGESNFDYLRVWFVPDTAFRVQANDFPTPGISGHSTLATAVIPDWIAVGGKLNLSSGWTTETDTVAIDAPGRYYLVFLWANDGGTGVNPPVAIDNIEVWNTTVACSSPTIDSIYADETSIFFSYSSEASGYEVAIVESMWADSSLVAEQAAQNSHTFTGLTASTQYTIGVRAFCGDINYSDWTYTTVTTAAHPCYAPTGLTVSNISFSNAEIAWTPGEIGQDNFQIRYSTGGDTVIRTIISSSNQSFTLNDLVSSTQYMVALRAVCGEGNYSDWSATSTFTTLTCQPVGSVDVANLTQNAVTINWTAGSNSNGNYEIEYGLRGFSQGTGTRVPVSDTRYTITDLEAGTDYEVYVRSQCAEGVYSGWNNGTLFSTTEGIGIDDVDDSRISLFPNPASSTVTLTGINDVTLVTVVDMNGRESGKWKVEGGELTLDVSNLAQGAYFVRITGERINAIRKLIIR